MESDSEENCLFQEVSASRPREMQQDGDDERRKSAKIDATLFS